MLDRIKDWICRGWNDQPTVRGECSTTSTWLKRIPTDKSAEREWRRFLTKYQPHARRLMRHWAHRGGPHRQYALDCVEDVWRDLIADILEKKTLLVLPPRKSFRKVLFRLVKCRTQNIGRELKPRARFERQTAPLRDGFTRERNDNERLMRDCVAFLKEHFVDCYDPVAKDVYGVTRLDHQIYVASVVRGKKQCDLAQRFGITPSAVFQIVAKVNRYLKAEATIYLRDLREAAHLAPSAA